MRTIALKTSDYEEIQNYVNDVVRQLGAQLIVVDSVNNLPTEGIDLLMWHRPESDSGQLKAVHQMFPRLVRLEDWTGRDHAAGDQPGLVMPADPEDAALVLTYSSWAKKHGIDAHFWLQ